jgi:tape measure domain-containing protein
MAANRVIAVRFVVDKNELSKEMGRLNTQANKLEKNFAELSGGTGKLTREQRQLWNSYLRTQKATGDLTREGIAYHKFQQDLQRQLKAGVLTTQEYNKALERQTTLLAKRASTGARTRRNVGGAPGVDVSGASAAIPVFGKLSTVLKAFSVIQVSRSLTNLSKDVIVVGAEMERLEKQVQRLSGDGYGFSRTIQMANELGITIADSAQQISRFSPLLARMGKSFDESADFVETLNKSMKFFGVSSVEAANAATQLGQSIGSGTFQGDELRSVSETSGAWAAQLRDIVKEITGATGSLKEMGSEGVISAEVLIEGAGVNEHADHAGHVGGVPIADGLVEGAGVPEHAGH